jgi:solute carrier family 35, member C2
MVAMCKSSALGFVLIFAFLFRLEEPSWRLVGIIVTMTIGVIMMVASETAFNALGFILIMASSCSSGFRWSLTQILLLRNPATSNPFSTIMYLAPVIFVSLLAIAIPVEGIPHLIIGLHDLMEARGTITGILILLFPGLLAFLMMTSEFALLKRTSVVTLSICGIFKEVVTISAASIAFNDKLTPINVSGLIITIASIGLYNYMKIQKMKQEALREQQAGGNNNGQNGYAPVPAGEGGILDDGLNGGDPVPRRQSSGSPPHGLLRGTLSIPPHVIRDVTTESPARSSPVKRPEDLE